MIIVGVYTVYNVLTGITDRLMSLGVVRVVGMPRWGDALPAEAQDPGGHEARHRQDQGDHEGREPGALHAQDRRRFRVWKSSTLITNSSSFSAFRACCFIFIFSKWHDEICKTKVPVGTSNTKRNRRHFRSTIKVMAIIISLPSSGVNELVINTF